jgi:hypothetical protein
VTSVTQPVRTAVAAPSTGPTAPPPGTQAAPAATAPPDLGSLPARPIPGPHQASFRSQHLRWLPSLGDGWIVGTGNVAATGSAKSSALPERAPNLPRIPIPGFTSAAASGGGAGGALMAFAALLLAFLLVIPNAGRWLRSVLALGLSPAYVALSDRPG